MNNNYHTHMYLCRHAEGDVYEYVEEAIRLGFKALGMSDHAPFEELKDRSVRMRPGDLPLYIQKCDEAIHQYKDRIQVYKALEIEYFEEHDWIYPNYLKHMDYLALGQHYISDESQNNHLRSSYALTTYSHLKKYIDTVIKAMSTGYFSFVCHPDLMLYNTYEFTKEVEQLSRRLIQASIDFDVPLEINANGIRKGKRMMKEGERYLYPRKEFWELVHVMGARVIVSSDAHQVSQLFDQDVLEAYQFAKEIGIVVEEEIKFKTQMH